MLLEFGEQAVDDKKTFRALLTDLFKDFDCLNHNHLKAKLHAYGLDLSALKLLQDSPLDCYKRMKIDFNLNDSQMILAGLPLGSILGSLLINIHMRDIHLTLSTTYFARYANNNTQ